MIRLWNSTAKLGLALSILALMVGGLRAQEGTAPGNATQELIGRVAADDASALIPLAFAYRSGDGVEPDVDRAVELVRTAIKKNVEGAGGALIAFAYGFQSGDGAPKDPTKAAGLFQEALDAGADGALVPLGFAYNSGNGVPQDKDKALDYVMRAVDADVEGAGGALVGLVYGLQSTDASRAAELFQRAADAGVKEALVPLAFAFQSGNGVVADPNKALQLFVAATEQGAEGAGGALVGVAYGIQAGGDAPPEPEKAASLFQTAVDSGAKEGLVPLGFAYLSGNGVSPDADKALSLFDRAVSEGVEGAGNALIAIAYAFQSGDGASKDPAKALAIFGRAADAGALGALVPLGYANLSGTGVRADKAVAFSYFRSAIEAGQKGSGTALRYSDENEYVRVMQDTLKKLGYFQGNIDGRVTSSTIRAFMQFCRDKDIEQTCKLGPLDPAAIETFVGKLAAN